MPRTYPDTTFERAARDAGASVRCLWEIAGPANTQVAWLACYDVNGWPVMVQTYREDNGWNVFTPGASNDVRASIADALDRCGVPPPPPVEAPVAAPVRKLGFGALPGVA